MNRKFLVLAVAVLTGFFIYSACTKLDTTDIGNDLIPAVDNVNTFDTVLYATTDNFLYPDTTDITQIGVQAIGLIGNDPEFGKTDAGLYFAITPGSFGSHPFVNPDSVTIDSIVLALPYNRLYGDSMAVENFEVYEIDAASGFKDSAWKIGSTPPTLKPTLLGNKTVTFTTLNDSVTYVNYASTTATLRDTVRTLNQLRIHLDPSFGTQFLDFDTSAAYKSDSAFRLAFGGLAVKINQGASPAPNALAYFSLTATPTATLTFYSRITRNGQEDTIAPAFSFPNRRLANLITRTPANNYATYLANGNPNDDLVFLQSSPGSFVTIKLPGLTGLSNRVIHRAELILDRVPAALDNIYTPSPLIFIDAINDAGDSTFTIRNDLVLSQGGTGYDIPSIEGVFKDNRYTFNLSRYVQTIVTKKLRNHTLRVYAPAATRPFFENGDGAASAFPNGFEFLVNSPVAAGRAVIAGGSFADISKRLRLRIIYSKI